MKTYVKPQLRFENYALSESIASGCGTDEGWVLRGYQDLSNCFVETDTLGIEDLRFFTNHDNCTNKEVEASCYTVLTGASGLLFNS